MPNKPTFLTANWTAPKQVKTLITTRIGVDSESFNLALHVNDDKEKVQQNRQILHKSLPTAPIWLNQVHSNLILEVDKSELNSLQTYDAALTRTTNTVCTVMTADCIPILMTDIKASFVAAIHAGWRGVQNQIIANSCKLSLAKPDEILIYIGPAICQKHFEVGVDVFDIFTALDTNNSQFFTHKNNQKFDCDLIGIATLQLINHGVLPTNIYSSNECTYCNNELFYSYRKEHVTGRFASCIWLE